MRIQGFSLTELLVTLVISLIVLSGILSAFLVSSFTVHSTTDRSELQQNAMMAMKLLIEDIQMVNFWGHYRGTLAYDDITQLSLSPARLNANLGHVQPVSMAALNNDCLAQDNRKTNNGSFMSHTSERAFITLWIGSKQASHSVLNNCVNKAVEYSEIIQIKRLLSPSYDARTVTLHDLTPSRYYAISKVNELIIFAGSESIPNFANGNKLSGQVNQYQHYVYYIENEKRILPSNHQVGHAVPILKRKYLYKAKLASRTEGKLKSQPLVEGIESIGILLGVDLNRNGVINAYITPDAFSIQDWELKRPSILAVKLHVLARTVNPDPNQHKPTQNLKYDMGSHTIEIDSNTFEARHYKRLLVSQTVFI